VLSDKQGLWVRRLTPDLVYTFNMYVSVQCTLMEDPVGFLHLPRTEASKEVARARVRHWHEYEQVMPGNQAATQARRCMDCGTPHCHRYCPVHNLIPDWNMLVTEQDWHAAWLQLDSTNNFPEFTGRICGAPCEDACTLSIGSRPVTIRSIELAIVERAWQSGWIRPQPARSKLFRRVAIIGSGPAGLSCAQQLTRVGYRVTVYEKADRIGGLLRYGIPDFRLEKQLLERRIAQLSAEGVSFRCGIDVGRDLDFEALHRNCHAVVLACGSEQPRALRVPGCDYAGIYYAMDYLRQQNRRIAGDFISSDAAIDARDRRVVVIGGGDTGGDCVGTAIRQGARCVTQLQYHDKPVAHVDNLDYWPDPVPALQLNDHDAEGCKYLWSYDTVALSGRNGCVSGLQLVKLHWQRSASGQWCKQPLADERMELPVDLVLLAMGYAHPKHDGLLRAVAADLDMRGNIQASDEHYMTSVDGVFACGDARRGQSQVVWAIREGRQCARSVDQCLSGDSLLPAV
jgi:glutamate synthase (NADPH/NADH) small chain